MDEAAVAAPDHTQPSRPRSHIRGGMTYNVPAAPERVSAEAAGSPGTCWKKYAQDQYSVCCGVPVPDDGQLLHVVHGSNIIHQVARNTPLLSPNLHPALSLLLLVAMTQLPVLAANSKFNTTHDLNSLECAQAVHATSGEESAGALCVSFDCRSRLSRVSSVDGSEQ